MLYVNHLMDDALLLERITLLFLVYKVNQLPRILGVKHKSLIFNFLSLFKIKIMGGHSYKYIIVLGTTSMHNYYQRFITRRNLEIWLTIN